MQISIYPFVSLVLVHHHNPLVLWPAVSISATYSAVVEERDLSNQLERMRWQCKWVELATLPLMIRKPILAGKPHGPVL